MARQTDDLQWAFGAIEALKNASPMGFLLRKAKNGRHLESFRLKPVKTDYFRRQVTDKLMSLKEKFDANEVRITRFHQDHDEHDESVVRVLDVQAHQTIRDTIDNIQQISSANEIDALDRLANAKFSALMFKDADGMSVIALDSVKIYSNRAFRKAGFLASYDESGIREFDGDAALVFTLGLPCMYFEKENKLLVFDKKATEKMFNMLEHYKKVAKLKLDELADLEILDIEPAVLNKALESITITRKISNMVSDEAFINDIDVYKKYDEYIKRKRIDDESVQVNVVNGKVVIRTVEDLRAFLHLAAYDIQSSVVDPEQIFLALRKRKVRRKA